MLKMRIVELQFPDGTQEAVEIEINNETSVIYNSKKFEIETNERGVVKFRQL